MAGPQDKVVSIAFRPDGALMAAGDLHRTLIVFDLVTRRPLGDDFTLPSTTAWPPWTSAPTASGSPQP